MKHFTLLFASLISICVAHAQFIVIDKTDRFGRFIVTNYNEIYEESGREGEFALSYIETADSVAFFLLFKSQEDLNIRTGDKMLFKHVNGIITEIECIDDGSKSTHVSSFGLQWMSPYPEFYRSTDGVMYMISEDQIKEIIENPVIKIRIEEEFRYTDRKTGNAKGKSKVSSFAEGALLSVKEALSTKKTGLYDGF